MTSTIAPSFGELKKYDKINVIDVGAARAFSELENILILEMSMLLALILLIMV